MSNFWFHYWWPSLQGNGPEDLTSLIIIGIVTSIVVPKVRRWWITREQHLHAKVDLMLKQNAHLIHHTKSVPNEHSDGTDLSHVPEDLKGLP